MRTAPRTHSCITAAAVLVSLLVGAAAATAQDHRFGVAPRVGMAVPLGQLGNMLEAGPSVGVTVSLPVHQRVALRADVHNNMFSGKALSTGRTAADANIWNLQFGAEADVLAPAAMPLVVSLDAGVGALVVDGPEYNFTPLRTESHRTGHASARAGVSLGYAIRPSINVMAGAQYIVAHGKREQNAWFSDQDPENQARFTGLKMAPITLGVRARI